MAKETRTPPEPQQDAPPVLGPFIGYRKDGVGNYHVLAVWTQGSQVTKTEVFAKHLPDRLAMEDQIKMAVVKYIFEIG